MSDAPFEQVIGADLARDLSSALLCVFVAHRRRASNHPEMLRVKAPQLGNDFLCDSVRQIVLLGVAGEVFQRKNDQHDLPQGWFAVCRGS